MAVKKPSQQLEQYGFYYVLPHSPHMLSTQLVSTELWQPIFELVPEPALNPDYVEAFKQDSETVVAPQIQEPAAKSQASTLPSLPVNEQSESSNFTPSNNDDLSVQRANVEAQTDTKEKDDRDGHEAPLSIGFGAQAPVDSIPRDLGIFFERQGFIEDIGTPVDRDSGTHHVREINCINGTWHMVISYQGITPTVGNLNPGDVPFDPDNPLNDPVIYNASITFGDGVDSYTFTTSYGAGAVFDFPTLTGRISGTFSIPIDVTLPDNFNPTEMSTSIALDYATPDPSGLTLIYLENAFGSTLGNRFNFGLGQLEDIGPVPFVNESGQTIFNGSPTDAFNFADNFTTDLDTQGANIAPGNYQTDNDSYRVAGFETFEDQLLLACQPQLPLGLLSPVGIDLSNNGIDLVSAQESLVAFDVNGDNLAESIGWVAPSDGMLIFDYNGDRLVTQFDEFVLTEYSALAQTDLEALQIAFDVNDDFVFDALDSAWQNFGVWQDRNNDGLSTEDEFSTLDELGIESILLDINPIDAMLMGNAIFGSATVNFTDGSTTQAYDLGLSVVEPVANHSQSVDMTPSSDSFAIPVQDTSVDAVQDLSNLNPDI